MKLQANFLDQFLLIILIILNLNFWVGKSYGQIPPQLKDQDIETITLQHMPPETDIFAPTPWMEAQNVVLQGLDKITARVFTVTARINQLIKFGNLEIYVRKGYKAPPEEPPESVCFLEIFERKTDETATLIFAGWMFASNPSLYPLEHPIYDVWIKEIKTAPQQRGLEVGSSENKLSAINRLLSPDLIEDGF
jgi:hypothetical protein